MKTEEFKFRIVTPMFLGGADQTAESIRPASIKGALRFWWRALNWARCSQTHPQSGDQAIRMLHAEEARLFGVSAGDTEGGQGVFLLSIGKEEVRAAKDAKNIFPNLQNGQIYLLGMGLAKYDSASKQTLIQRSALQKGGTFTLRLAFHPKASNEDTKQVRDAVKAFELLGALGSRARHGLGSLAPTTVSSRAEYEKAIQELLKPTLCATSEPPFTAFSALSRVDVSATANDALKLLDAVGCEQQLFRGFGREGKVNGVSAERNFTDDHDDILKATQGGPLTRAPKRVVFGLPHNYFFSSTKGKADVNYAPDGNDARRASPLLLHIHPVSDGGYVAVHTLLPAQFLPKGGQIRIKAKSNSLVPAEPEWQELRNYLNRFIDKKEGDVVHGQQ